MSEYMGKKVNAFLLIMVILVLLGMGGLSIYYQRTFKNVNSAYEDVSTELQTCKQDLTVTSTNLQDAQKSLNSTESDIRKYDTLYEQKARELEQTKDVLSQTKTNLSREILLKEQFKRQSDLYLGNIRSLNSTITQLSNDITNLKRDISRLESRISCLKLREGSEENSCFT